MQVQVGRGDPKLGSVIERSGRPKIKRKVLGSRSRLSEKSKLDLEDQSLAGSKQTGGVTVRSGSRREQP